MLRISLRPAVVALIVSEPALRVPAPTAMITVKPADGLGMLISPVTVRELVPLIVMRLLAVAAANVTELHTAAVSTVKLIPALIVTVSAATGTAAPPHVAVLLQLPLTEAVLAAAATYGPMYGPPMPSGEAPIG
jgi:hypothetical protein